MAISGGSAIVGAHVSDDAGSNSGSAYVFDVDPLSATFGNELVKLTASDAAAGDLFGISVGISGDTAIVGAYLNDDDGTDSGSAYVFDVDPLSATFGNELVKLTASDAAAGDQFGISVAISGDTAVVGAYLDDDGGDDSGSAYVFDADPLSTDLW